MHLRPFHIQVPRWITAPAEWVLTGLYFALFGLPLLALVAWQRLEDRIPKEWTPHFAWWPTRCDDWLNDGFVGTVWLETVERRNAFPHGVQYRRPAAS
jgi:hypothetical protein